ncbi:hypothetical protein BDR07DRAFT_646153 [Suillus spraguei]|nr:hypothetical protein BDR07DRAFT_646153 [Suillus spraguei]
MFIDSILSGLWEVLALCLAIWIAVRHFRELQRQSTGGTTIKDCFMVLMETHLPYFMTVAAVSCLQIILNVSMTNSVGESPVGAQICGGLLRILEVMQMFVLGPRLILSVREYHAKLVADSDAATGMTSIAFEERVHISTDSSVLIPGEVIGCLVLYVQEY